MMPLSEIIVPQAIWPRQRGQFVRAAAGRPGSAHPLIIAVREAGRFLNEVTHHAHIIEELPADEELMDALDRIHLAVRDVLR